MDPDSAHSDLHFAMNSSPAAFETDGLAAVGTMVFRSISSHWRYPPGSITAPVRLGNILRRMSRINRCCYDQMRASQVEVRNSSRHTQHLKQILQQPIRIVVLHNHRESSKVHDIVLPDEMFWYGP